MAANEIFTTFFILMLASTVIFRRIWPGAAIFIAGTALNGFYFFDFNQNFVAVLPGELLLIAILTSLSMATRYSWQSIKMFISAICLFGQAENDEEGRKLYALISFWRQKSWKSAVIVTSATGLSLFIYRLIEGSNSIYNYWAEAEITLLVIPVICLTIMNQLWLPLIARKFAGITEDIAGPPGPEELPGIVWLFPLLAVMAAWSFEMAQYFSSLF